MSSSIDTAISVMGSVRVSVRARKAGSTALCDSGRSPSGNQPSGTPLPHVFGCARFSRFLDIRTMSASPLIVNTSTCSYIRTWLLSSSGRSRLSSSRTANVIRSSDEVANCLSPMSLANRVALGVLSMKRTAKLVPILIALSLTSVVAADWPWLYGPRRNHTSEQKGLLRTWPQEGPKVLWAVPLAVGFGGPAVAGRKRVPVGPRREGGRYPARARFGERQGTVDLRLRCSRQFHVRRFTHDAHRRRGTRLHRRADGRPARHQHEDAKAGLAEEHLEGLWRQRATATVGDRPEPVDLR